MNKVEAHDKLVAGLTKQADKASKGWEAIEVGLKPFTKEWASHYVGKFAPDVAKASVLGLGALAAKPAMEAAIKKFTRPKGLLGNLKAMAAEDGVLRKALYLGTGAAGIAAGVKGVEALHDAVATPIAKARSFSAMMEENPGLRKEPPHDVKMRFNTLARFNPDMAADPVISGAFVRRALQFKEEGIQPMDVRDLISSRKDLESMRGSDNLLRKAFATKPLELSDING